jgi:hypothetical protein
MIKGGGDLITAAISVGSGESAGFSRASLGAETFLVVHVLLRAHEFMNVNMFASPFLVRSSV